MSRASDMRDKVTARYNAIPPNQIVTVSNLISLFRAFMTLPIIYSLQRGQGRTALIFIAIAVFSDILDGWLARISHAITDIGKVLDPFADAVVILSVALYLLAEEKIPDYFFYLLVMRYFLIAILGLLLLNNYGISPHSNKLGKVSIVFTATAIIAIIYQDKVGTLTIPLMWVAIVFLVVSGIWYLYSFTSQLLRAKKQKAVRKNG